MSSKQKCIFVLLILVVLDDFIALGTSTRLSYHEAIVAQTAREYVARRAWLIPTLGGQPWLEKPPLAFWLVAGLGQLGGGIDETVARLPSAVGTVILALTVGALARRRGGASLGYLATAVQLTMSWSVIRGRLAEVDMLLAALVTGAIVAFDGMRAEEPCSTAARAAEAESGCELEHGDTDQSNSASSARHRAWSRGREAVFFLLLGTTALAKGIGFGAALVLAVVAAVLLWDRDRKAFRALLWLPGWSIAGLVALTWPLLVLARCPRALELWVLHVAGRFDPVQGGFAGEHWGGYLLSPFLQLLPWTPLALAGLVRSWQQARRCRYGLDRLLFAWAVVPTVLVSLASARNAHYLIYALPPWSIWTAQALRRVAARLQERRGWAHESVQRCGTALFIVIGLAYASVYGLMSSRFDRRGEEWAWYASVGKMLPAGTPLVLLYDDWDRLPYPTPFGPVPHDLAVRLFYLERPASWRFGTEALEKAPPARSFAVIGRDRDRPALERVGQTQALHRGPVLRASASKVDDRAFVLFQVTPRQ